MSDGGGHSTAEAAGCAADDDAEAIRERQLKLQAAASKARAVKRRAEIVKAERTRERAREVLKKNCWECWKGGQDILWCKCNMRQNINAFYLGAGSSK